MTDVTTEQWEWDENTGEIRRTNSDEPLDFTREPEGRLAAAAPDMERALRIMLAAFPRATASEDEESAREAAVAALRKVRAS